MSKALKTSYAATASSSVTRGEPAVARPPNTLDGTLTDKWTPDRDGFMKVASLQDGNLRGGYWLLNKDGESATLAFCFKNTQGGIFGLTVSHLFNGVGDPVFAFLLRNPTLTPVYVRSGPATGQFNYEMIEIGEVVAIDEDTDTAIFEVTNTGVKNRVDLLKLLPRAGLGDRELVLPRPSLTPSGPTKNACCAVHGASSRGSMCIVSTPSLEPSNAKDEAIAGDIGFEKEYGCTEVATKDGDCGALYLDVTDGSPEAMHHAIITCEWPGTEKPTEYESLGVPLARIMAKHREQFDEQMYGSIEAPFDNENGGKEPKLAFNGHRQGAVISKSVQVKTFPVKIVKGDVTGLLASRANPYKGVKLDRSNAVVSVSGQIFRWDNIKAVDAMGEDSNECGK